MFKGVALFKRLDRTLKYSKSNKKKGKVISKFLWESIIFWIQNLKWIALIGCRFKESVPDFYDRFLVYKPYAFQTPEKVFSHEITENPSFIRFDNSIIYNPSFLSPENENSRLEMNRGWMLTSLISSNEFQRGIYQDLSDPLNLPPPPRHTCKEACLL